MMTKEKSRLTTGSNHKVLNKLPKNSIAFCGCEVKKTGLLSLFFRLDTDIKFVTGETRCHTKRSHTTVEKRLR